MANNPLGYYTSVLGSAATGKDHKTLPDQAPANLGQLLTGSTPKNMKKDSFWTSKGGGALSSILGTAGIAGLGALIGAIASPGARGLGAARGAGFGAGFGALTDLDTRRAAASGPYYQAQTELDRAKMEQQGALARSAQAISQQQAATSAGGLKLKEKKHGETGVVGKVQVYMNARAKADEYNMMEDQYNKGKITEEELRMYDLTPSEVNALENVPTEEEFNIYHGSSGYTARKKATGG